MSATTKKPGNIYRDRYGRRYRVFILTDTLSFTLLQEAREIAASLAGLTSVEAVQMLRLPPGLRWSIVPVREETRAVPDDPSEAIRRAAAHIAAAGEPPNRIYLDAKQKAVWDALAPLVADGTLTDHDQLKVMVLLRYNRYPATPADLMVRRRRRWRWPWYATDATE